MSQNPSTNSKGFTLIEAMVAIAVLSLAITGPMIIAQKGIASAIYARDQITASYLAQEGIEYIRNIRDTNRIRNEAWIGDPASFLSICHEDGTGKKCEVDPFYDDFNNVLAIKPCSGTCNKLYFDTTNNLYRPSASQPTGWKATPFTRSVTIDPRASNKEVLISVEISWTTGLFNPARKFSVKEYLSNF